MVGFGLVLPTLVALSVGIVEFSLLMMEYQRASDATRRGARMASMAKPVADVVGFGRGSVSSCTASGGVVSCDGQEPATPQVFNDVLADMQEILPNLQADNVEIVYQDSGLGDPTTPGGVIPVVTVRLVNLPHTFVAAGAVPGIPATITYPPFATNQMGTGLGMTEGGGG
ncbi:MAG: pilus assembly protein, partial [Rhodospirillales bacterium]|nr:pilus assembly protein [Rhodospirillales bacterium]